MLFRPLLPDRVSLAEIDPRVVDPALLLPEERLAVERAVPKRQREHAAGRHLARGLLSERGVPAGPLLAAPDRAPRWPDGVVGSITHCDDFAAVAIASAAELGAIGLDVEPALPLPPGVFSSILRAEERHDTRWGPAYGRLVFCAKEAFYKSIYPITKKYLDFHDVRTRFSDEGFEATLLVPAPPFPQGAQLRGRWRNDGIHLATAVVLELHAVPARSA